MNSAITEQEFWQHVQSVSVEVEDAIAVFHTYEEINRLGAEEDAIFRAFNADALFWNVQTHSLLTTLFVTLSRVFDQDQNTLSIHRLLNETLAHPEFFSKDALRKRKSDLKIPPEYIYLLDDEGWYPGDASELRYLKNALKPHARKFTEIYLPIRHLYIAHRVLETDKPVNNLFSMTNRKELGAILDFLHDLMGGITHLYLNGVKPELGAREFSHYNNKIRSSVRKVINKVAGFQPALDE